MNENVMFGNASKSSKVINKLYLKEQARLALLEFDKLFIKNSKTKIEMKKVTILITQ